MTPLLLVLAMASQAASRDPAIDAVQSYRKSHEREIVRELADFLAIPNVSSDTQNIRRNAEHLVVMLQKRGVTARLLGETGAPAVYGELRTPGAKATLALYAHYDGQPVTPADWTTPPFTPTLRDRPLEEPGSGVLPFGAPGAALPPEARLYARGASDDKGTIVAMLAALDALRASSIPLSVNVKLLFEGEEEAGSPNLPALFQASRDLLAADLWLLCDGPVHQSRRPQIFLGARGITEVEITMYGPLRALHSGHYGNWAPNPAVELAHLLTKLRGRDGEILVRGFLDDVRPPSEAEKRALSEIPDVDPELRAALGLAATEAGNAKSVARILLPALNVRGLESGRVGEKAANAIPTEARASIDFRLVPDQTPDGVKRKVEAHLAAEGYHVVHETPDLAMRRAHARIVKLGWGRSGYPAARTPLDAPAVKAVASVLDAALPLPVLKLPTLGGSIPMYLFAQALEAPVVGFPIANHDNNQHAANECLRLQNLWDGIEAYALLFARLGGAGLAR